MTYDQATESLTQKAMAEELSRFGMNNIEVQEALRRTW